MALKVSRELQLMSTRQKLNPMLRNLRFFYLCFQGKLQHLKTVTPRSRREHKNVHATESGAS